MEQIRMVAKLVPLSEDARKTASHLHALHREGMAWPPQNIGLILSQLFYRGVITPEGEVVFIVPTKRQMDIFKRQGLSIPRPKVRKHRWEEEWDCNDREEFYALTHKALPKWAQIHLKGLLMPPLTEGGRDSSSKKEGINPPSGYDNRTEHAHHKTKAVYVWVGASERTWEMRNVNVYHRSHGKHGKKAAPHREERLFHLAEQVPVEVEVVTLPKVDRAVEYEKAVKNN